MASGLGISNLTKESQSSSAIEPSYRNATATDSKSARTVHVKISPPARGLTKVLLKVFNG